MSRSIECRTLVGVMLACMFASAVCAPAPLCAGADGDDPRAARFCQALNTFLELYAEAAGEQVPEYQALVHEYPQLFDTGVKREDVTHRLLRIGRSPQVPDEAFLRPGQLRSEEYAPLIAALVRDYPQLLDTGMKRQDVVHSFLRFGRRR